MQLTLTIRTAATPDGLKQQEDVLVTANCIEGEIVTGGGYSATGAFLVKASYPSTSNNSWNVVVDIGTKGGSVTASAQCAALTSWANIAVIVVALFSYVFFPNFSTGSWDTVFLNPRTLHERSAKLVHMLGVVGQSTTSQILRGQ